MIHVDSRIKPEPDRPKDHISHGLYWSRTGMHYSHASEYEFDHTRCRFPRLALPMISQHLYRLKGVPDPYSREEQANFAKW